MKSLNVKVGDVVSIIDKEFGNTTHISKVVKVLPNGRFLTEYDKTYWKADGTRNTKARKYDKRHIAIIGDKKQFEQMLRYEFGKFLKRIGDAAMNLNLNNENIITISRFFTIFGIDIPKELEHLYSRINQVNQINNEGKTNENDV